jgi:hypothetical protein
MKVSTENDNNFGYEKNTIVVDNIPLIINEHNKKGTTIYDIVNPGLGVCTKHLAGLSRSLISQTGGVKPVFDTPNHLTLGNCISNGLIYITNNNIFCILMGIIQRSIFPRYLSIFKFDFKNIK